MDAATQALFEQLGIALLLGLLVGFQRQHSEFVLAGVRTFPLITLFGAMVASLDQRLESGGWTIAAGLISVAAMVVIAGMQPIRGEKNEYGMTTQAAVLVMFAVGAYVVVGERIVAIAIGAGTAALLQFKPELHGLSTRLGDEDLRAIMTFSLITCIILPVLPNRTYAVVAPLDVLNPFETWLMVVLMVGISLGGYLTYKFFGRNAGILLGGILGGAISSTATTISYSKRTMDNPASTGLAALVILIASTIVYARVLLEILVVAPNHIKELGLPIVLMMGSAIIATMVCGLQRTSGEEMPTQKNPTELRSAVIFALLYAGVLMALSTTRTLFDNQGIYGVAVLSGLTDMDAITLSTARMVKSGTENGGITADTGWRLIMVASMSNLFFKTCIVAAAGNRRLLLRIILLFAGPFAAGSLILWLWPTAS